MKMLKIILVLFLISNSGNAISDGFLAGIAISDDVVSGSVINESNDAKLGLTKNSTASYSSNNVDIDDLEINPDDFKSTVSVIKNDTDEDISLTINGDVSAISGNKVNISSMVDCAGVACFSDVESISINNSNIQQAK